MIVRPAQFGKIPTPIIQRLLLHRSIDATGCWNWTGDRSQKGYGRITVGSRALGTNKTVWVHRLAAEIWKGFVPNPTVYICHHCDNPSCFNPEHLFTGTSLDNNRDCKAKGRSPKAMGILNGASKLDDGKVIEIRKTKETSGLSDREIAKAFGVSQTLVSRILRGKAWAHVA